MVKDFLRTLRNKFLFRKYGSFGKTSYMEKPLRIIHPERIFVGEHVSILQGLRMEAETNWQGQKLKGRIIIKDGTSLEQGCHIIAANKLVIGEHCTISAHVYISDCSHCYEDITKDVKEQPLIVKKTTIGDGTFIGFGCFILPGVQVGKHCVIGANSVVTHDVPDYTVVAGSPARMIKHYNMDSQEWQPLN